jgi:DNA-binding FadR family transcriptional regulator
MVITMPATSQPVLQNSRLSRAEAVAREIEEQISAGVLSSGDRLGTKDDVRQRFRVAVATVNEAVKLLETRGLVEARPGPGGGVFVASPEARMRSGPMFVGFEWAKASMADCHEVRRVLEPVIYQHAARHRTGADVRALRSILASMSAHLDQPTAYARYHAAFHRRIARMSLNAPLRSMYVTLLDFFENDLATAGPLAGWPLAEPRPARAGYHRVSPRYPRRQACLTRSAMIVVSRRHSRVPGGEA